METARMQNSTPAHRWQRLDDSRRLSRDSSRRGHGCGLPRLAGALLALGAAFVLGVTPAQAQPGAPPSAPAPSPTRPARTVDALDSDYSIMEGNQENWFSSRGNASSHTIVTNAADPRILVAYPDGNSGTGIWFDRREKANDGLTLRALVPPRSTAGHEASPGSGQPPPACQGVSARFSAGRPEIVATEYVLDSVRVLRSQAREGSKEGPDAYRSARQYARERDPRLPAGWVQEAWKRVERADGRPSLVIERAELNGGHYRLELVFERGTTFAKEGHAIRIRSGDGRPLLFDLQSTVPFADLHRLTPQALFRPAALDALRSLGRRAEEPGASRAVKIDHALYFAGLRDLLFLSREEKSMAGAWRFMTYFGRDTMISLMMLQDILTPAARENGIMSVLARLAPDGDVAHEEDIGSFAVLRNLEGGKAGTGPLSALLAPVFDYKMVDDDFLLPMLAARHLTDPEQSLAQGRAFLARSDNLERLLANWDLVLRRALPYARSQSPSDLVRIGAGLSVGNWRDSGPGLGGGVFPGDVNADLVVEALAGIRRVVGSGVVTEADIRAVASRRGFTALPEALSLGPVEKAWKRARRPLECTLAPQELRTRLSRFLGFPGGPSGRSGDVAVSAQERAWALGLKFADGSTLEAFLRGPHVPAELQAPLRFTALSLDAQGRPVEVMNSDFVFRLFLGNPMPEEVGHLVRLVELPYPVGLMTPVGPVVANAATSRDARLWKALGRDAYHGAVMWSWQTSMLELGLLRQWQRFREDPTQAPLAGRLRKAALAVAAARRRAGEVASSELWTWDAEPGRVLAVAFGARASSETESNAVQLWSTVFPAVLLEAARLR